MRKFISVLFFILILAFIWTQSVMPQKLSSAESNFIMNLVRPFLEIFVGRGNVNSSMVRKIAHYTEFAFLGLFSYFLISWKNQKTFSRVIKSLIICFVVAFLDESIQIFTGRGPSIRDVWVDLSGVFVGILVAGVHILSDNISQ